MNIITEYNDLIYAEAKSVVKLISHTKRNKSWSGNETWRLNYVLVSLFNGISTLYRLFNAKAILLEEQ